jgi:hypothetical protein
MILSDGRAVLRLNALADDARSVSGDPLSDERDRARRRLHCEFRRYLHSTSPDRPRRLMPAFPPVAVLLVGTAPALQPLVEPVARLARLLHFGIVAGAALALRIHSEPPLDERRLRLGRGRKPEAGAQRGHHERDRAADPPRPPPAPRSSASGGQRNVDCPHRARNIGGASALQALRRVRTALGRSGKNEPQGGVRNHRDPQRRTGIRPAAAFTAAIRKSASRRLRPPLCGPIPSLPITDPGGRQASDSNHEPLVVHPFALRSTTRFALPCERSTAPGSTTRTATVTPMTDFT